MNGRKKRLASIVLGGVAVVVAGLTGPMLYQRVMEKRYIELLETGDAYEQVEALKALVELREAHAIPDIVRVMVQQCRVTTEEEPFGIWWSCGEALLGLGKEGSAALFQAAIDDESGRVWTQLYQYQVSPINIDGDQVTGALEASERAISEGSSSSDRRCRAIQVMAYACQDITACRHLKDICEALSEDPNECIADYAMLLRDMMANEDRR